MQVLRGTSLRAALIAGCLLEDSAFEFYTTLTPNGGNLDLHHAQADAVDGQLDIWWSVDIEMRDWGIKDIVPFVKKLKLHGWLEHAGERGKMREGDHFYFEYPETPPTQIGPDPDAPTPDNVVRLAAPKWNVDYRIDRLRKTRTTFAPSAEIDLSKRTIDILF